MTSSGFTIQDDFPPLDYPQWRALVESQQRGATFDNRLNSAAYDGIDLEALYTSATMEATPGLAGLAGRTELRQEHFGTDLKAVNQAILNDLSGGVDSILLRLASAAGPGGASGAIIRSVDDLDAALADVDLTKVTVALDAGAMSWPAAAMLVALWQRRQIAPIDARGAFHADPLAELARRAQLPFRLDEAFSQLANLAQWASHHYPQVAAVCVDTSVYNHAGANAVQELASCLATGVAYLRVMTEAGMEVNAAVRQMELRLSLGTHHFLEIAKLRAVRLLWTRVINVCGGDGELLPKINATTSNRVFTRREPANNILRNSAAMFAACVGGADVVTSVPFDNTAQLPCEQPSEKSRRIARNTVLLLQQEAHLRRVSDPAHGSWFLETATQQLAEAAWQLFQTIEGRGGMHAVLASGWWHEQIKATNQRWCDDMAQCRESLIGVNAFVDLGAESLATAPATSLPTMPQNRTTSQPDLPALSPSQLTAAVEAAAEGATMGQLSTSLGFQTAAVEIAPLEARSLAQPFEDLRDATDRWFAEHGQRPGAFVVNFGPMSDTAKQATFAQRILEVAVVEVIASGEVFPSLPLAVAAFKQSGASIAVVCAAEEMQPELVPHAATQLKQAGARTVLLVGAPGPQREQWRSAGVDDFVFEHCPVLALLQDLLKREGVMPR